MIELIDDLIRKLEYVHHWRDKRITCEERDFAIEILEYLKNQVEKAKPL